MFKMTVSGDVGKTEQWLDRILNRKTARARQVLDLYGRMGVEALSSATPRDSGVTAGAWGYVVNMDGRYSITWTNSNIVNGVPIAIILQYGHATRGGGFVQGYDYINPAIRGVMDNLAMELWKEMTN